MIVSGEKGRLYVSRKKLHQVAPFLERDIRLGRRAKLARIRRESEELNKKIKASQSRTVEGEKPKGGVRGFFDKVKNGLLRLRQSR